MAYAATTPRLYLQSLSEEEHLQDYHLINSNEKSMFWSTKKVYTDIEQTRQLIRECLPSPGREWNERWAILLKQDLKNEGGDLVNGRGNERGKDGKGADWVSGAGGMNENVAEMDGEEVKSEKKDKLRMIGTIGIVREQEVGYKLHPEFWGSGFMSEALGCFIEMFWKMPVNKKYDRLLAAADPENLASRRVLEKAGFQRGEYKKDFYERGVLGGKKSDLQSFYLERPNSHQ